MKIPVSFDRPVAVSSPGEVSVNRQRHILYNSGRTGVSSFVASIVCPPGETWKIERISIWLTTTPTVGNRMLILQVSQGGHITYYTDAHDTSENGLCQFMLAPEYDSVYFGSTALRRVYRPLDLALLPGDTISLFNVNVDALDAYEWTTVYNSMVIT